LKLNVTRAIMNDSLGLKQAGSDTGHIKVAKYDSKFILRGQDIDKSQRYFQLHTIACYTCE
jgi:hypothetical protein